MKREIPADLKNAFAVSFFFAGLLFLVQCALFAALVLQGLLWRFNAGKGVDTSLWAWTAAALALNGYALSRAVKARHFLGLFSEWPGLPEEKAAENETRLLAASARHAFLHRDFERVGPLLRRLPQPSAAAELALGRSLVMQGEFEEALGPLDKGGLGSAARRYLTLRRRLGLWKRRYFQPSDLNWATNGLRLSALAVAALALAVPMLSLNYDLLSIVTKPFTAGGGFSDQNFEVVQRGRFTLHYHDEAFMEQTAELAEEGLTQDLEFLDLPQDTFAPGQINLFLCDNQAEYLSRSPFTRAWEAASAVPTLGQVYLYKLGDRQKIYYEIVVAHELSHLCYHKLVAHGTDDSWLNEGLADYLGYKFGLERAHYPRQAWLLTNHFASLKERALSFDIFLQDSPRQYTDTKDIETFYTQGFSIVFVLIEDYGRDPFLRFLRVFGTGRPLAESLQASYPTIRNATELQAVWALFMR